MSTIVGLGQAGCQIAEKFNQYPQYNTICIDVEDDGYTNFIKIAEQSSHEDYEANYKKLKIKCDKEVSLILAGTGKITGCSLRLLEQLKNKKVSIYYIKADQNDLDEKGKLRERATFFILQEYARSGAFEKICLIDNKKVEEILEGLSVLNYWDRINETICSTIHMLNWFKNTKPVMKNFISTVEPAKISTIGILDMDKDKENLFYDLTSPRHKCYYYAISNKSLEEDGSLLGTIKKLTRERLEDKCSSNYGIFSTDWDQNYCYVEQHASMIQEINLP